MLPRGWGGFLKQLLIFAVFDVAYELSRGLADGKWPVARAHAYDVVHAEQGLGIYVERDVQDWALDAPHVVLDVANWTYFNCQFTISACFLIWAYVRRYESYFFLRNVVLAADFLALIGYIGFPTAPPRLLAGEGFVDTLNQTAVNHESPIVELFANPYAAVPSLHTAYAIAIGTAGVLLARHQLVKAIWALYPGLVVFSIVATANHFILDAVAGALTLSVAFGVALGLRAHGRARSEAGT